MSITLEEFQTRLREASAGGAFARLVRRQLLKTALEAEGKAKMRVTGGNPLKTRSGRLRSSIRGGVRSKTGNRHEMEGYLRAGGGLNFGGVQGGQVRYARIHELGGTIVPRNARYLAIPTDIQRTASGVSRAGPRQTPNLAFAQALGGQPVLVNTQTGAAHFLLRTRVVIPPRPYLRPSIKEAADKLPAAMWPLLGRSLKVDL